jgi:hypothetical protein
VATLLAAAAVDLALLAARLEEAAEKIIQLLSVRPQRLKAQSKSSPYRSAEALRHPKAGQTEFFRNLWNSSPYRILGNPGSWFIQRKRDVMAAETLPSHP